MSDSKLNKALVKFLRLRRESDGGWAPVSEEDLEHLHEVVTALLEAKWGRDPDGDLPVDIRIVDCTRETMRPFFAIPRVDEDRPDMKKQALRAFELSLANLEIAASGMDKYLRLARLKSDPETEAMAEALDKALPIEPPLGLGKIHATLEEQRQQEVEHIYREKRGDWFVGAYTMYNSRDWPEQPWELAGGCLGYRRTVYVVNPADPEGGPIEMVLTIAFQKGTADVEEITFKEKTD